MELLVILILCLVSFICGAYLDHRFHARAAAAMQAEREKLLADYRELITKAHDERDALFAKFTTTG